MALKKPEKNAAPKFDADEGGAEDATVKGESSAPAASPAPAAAPAAGPADSAVANAEADTQALANESSAPAAASTAVATKTTSSALAIGGTGKMADVLGAVHNNVRVDWNSLPQVQAVQGTFKRKEDKKPMGDTIEFQLISTQENFAVTPGVDDEEATQYVRYSDDGINLKDGTATVAEHIKLMKDLGYDKAKCSERIVLVGALTDAGKLADEMNGELFQIDLAPTSLAKFKSHKIQCAWKVNNGSLTAERALMIKAVCEPASAKGRDWTVVKFFTPAAPAA